MEVVLIAAVAENQVIGKEGKLVFHDPRDIEHFKELTEYHPVIMGRRTYESIPERFRPLKRRTNIVLTQNPDYNPEGVVVISHSMITALDYAQSILRRSNDSVFVAGGGDVFEQAMPHANWLELTEVHRHLEGDTFFPQIHPIRWDEVQRERHDLFDFVTYHRRS